jgi:hypothetical protein
MRTILAVAREQPCAVACKTSRSWNDKPPSKGKACTSCHPVHLAKFGSGASCHPRSVTGLPKRSAAQPPRRHPLEGKHTPRARELSLSKSRSSQVAAAFDLPTVADKHEGESPRAATASARGHPVAAFQTERSARRAREHRVSRWQARRHAYGKHTGHPRLTSSCQRCADCHDNPHGTVRAELAARGAAGTTDWHQSNQSRDWPPRCARANDVRGCHGVSRRVQPAACA